MSLPESEYVGVKNEVSEAITRILQEYAGNDTDINVSVRCLDNGLTQIFAENVETLQLVHALYKEAGYYVNVRQTFNDGAKASFEVFGSNISLDGVHAELDAITDPDGEVDESDINNSLAARGAIALAVPRNIYASIHFAVTPHIVKEALDRGVLENTPNAFGDEGDPFPVSGNSQHDYSFRLAR
ncbi:MAG: hypothetical protein GC136_01195 [Alphaproteobacteria bacterium]|nr:hypothetical protein [Alphaproteobacteria bacterium]